MESDNEMEDSDKRTDSSMSSDDMEGSDHGQAVEVPEEMTTNHDSNDRPVAHVPLIPSDDEPEREQAPARNRPQSAEQKRREEDKRREEEEEYWKNRAEAFLKKMLEAWYTDTEDFMAGRHPFSRLRFMKEIKMAIMRKDLLRQLIKLKFLNVCADFISPYRDEDGRLTFPTVGLVRDMIDVLRRLNVTRGTLSNSTIVKHLEAARIPPRTPLDRERTSLLNKWKRIVLTAGDDSDGGDASEAEDDADVTTDVRARTFHREELDELNRHSQRSQDTTFDLEELKAERRVRKLRAEMRVVEPRQFPEPERFVVSSNSKGHGSSMRHARRS